MINHFQESEIPYLQNICNGRRSPVLPITVTTEDGETEAARTRFSLVRTQNGGVDVLFYPKLDEYDLKIFNDQQKQRLLEGKAIIGHLESNEENKEAGGKRFFQIDPESKQVLCVPMPVIGRNMQFVADSYHLTAAEMQKLQNGDVLSILSGNDEEIAIKGMDYLYGYHGIVRDTHLAFRCLSYAKDKGIALAEGLLGQMYYYGIGVDKDENKGVV